MRKRKERKRTK
jgi:hypothetical protein